MLGYIVDIGISRNSTCSIARYIVIYIYIYIYVFFLIIYIYCIINININIIINNIYIIAILF